MLVQFSFHFIFTFYFVLLFCLSGWLIIENNVSNPELLTLKKVGIERLLPFKIHTPPSLQYVLHSLPRNESIPLSLAEPFYVYLEENCLKNKIFILRLALSAILFPDQVKILFLLRTSK